ncbi:hypothetical protein QUB80_22380 [Chlorogloeopsis sp. ULAP01]|uniref:hypothetical protein n=1 Tax=Chlorogloeopsis sp. ULAP01 TaxID=3056483 RepID=UPI0025AB2A39|nr:hypothetical protein [Chlorogloeopsis sp. ULAP01]MDM9383439.1 hypothetical protein [Chlorogloeopsis sp. ULAP01]
MGGSTHHYRKPCKPHTRVIHVFDREGDITEVFDKTRQLQHTGVLIRAAHNRSLDRDSERLWSKLEAQPISFEQEIELPSTSQRPARQTKLAIRFCQINLRTPYRFDNRDPLPVYAVYRSFVTLGRGKKEIRVRQEDKNGISKVINNGLK